MNDFEGLDDFMVTLNDSNGQEVHFEFLDLIDYQGKAYVVLLPVDVDEEAGEVFILQVEKHDTDAESESYISVEDEEILMAVYAIFKEKFRDEFDFMDD